MIVAGWADGYRNNSFRTVAALAAQGMPHRLLAGPWAHADPTTAMPGPRIDFDAELAGWFDHWLRGARRHTTTAATSSCVRPPGRSRTSTCTRATGCRCRRCRRPRPSSGCCAGPRLLDGPRRRRHGRLDRLRRAPALGAVRRPAPRRRPLADLGPPPPELPVVGHPVARLRVPPPRPAASLSVKLCDVFPDGTSALVTRGTLDLAFRDGVHGPRRPWSRARSTTSRWSSTPAPTRGPRARCCGSASPAPTGPTRSLRRPRSR